MGALLLCMEHSSIAHSPASTTARPPKPYLLSLLHHIRLVLQCSALLGLACSIVLLAFNLGAP